MGIGKAEQGNPSTSSKAVEINRLKLRKQINYNVHVHITSPLYPGVPT
jgi:hypothetical protein